MTKKFPTEKEFLAWWKGKRDNDLNDRTEMCPIARFLRAHGYPNAWVGRLSWGIGSVSGVRKLPFWATRRVNHFDLDLDERARRIGGLR